MSKQQLRAFCLLYTMLRAVLLIHVSKDDIFVDECDEIMAELVRDCGFEVVE